MKLLLRSIQKIQKASGDIGQWSNVKGIYNFADPLGLDLFSHYPNIAKRISSVQGEQVLKDESPLQSQNSNLCGFYCFYIAHFF